MNSTLGSVVPLAMFLDFPQNFRLSTWNQYCTQAIAWSTILDGGNTILDGGSTILDGSSTIFCRISQFTLFCRDLHYVAIYALFPQFFFGQNSLLCNITRFLHVWLYCLKIFQTWFVDCQHVCQSLWWVFSRSTAFLSPNHPSTSLTFMSISAELHLNWECLNLTL